MLNSDKFDQWRIRRRMWSNMYSVQSPTRFSPTSSRCIDLILGNFPELSQAMVEHVDFTDHALISSSLNTTVEKKHQAMETTRRTWPSREKLSSATSDFQHVLQFYMQTLPTGVDVDNMWEEWKQRFNTALDEVAPRVTKVHSHKRRHCPWMTKELLNQIHKQKSLHRDASLNQLTKTQNWLQDTVLCATKQTISTAG